MIFLTKVMCAIAVAHNFYGPLFTVLQEQVPAGSPNMYAPLINVGAVGVCLIVLAIYFKQKDARYEKRIDEALAREQVFGEKYADLAEKYRTALEKSNSTLDTVLQLLRQQTSR